MSLGLGSAAYKRNGFVFKASMQSIPASRKMKTDDSGTTVILKSTEVGDALRSVSWKYWKQGVLAAPKPPQA